jgi:hypothetical protein
VDGYLSTAKKMQSLRPPNTIFSFVAIVVLSTNPEIFVPKQVAIHVKRRKTGGKGGQAGRINTIHCLRMICEIITCR